MQRGMAKRGHTNNSLRCTRFRGLGSGGGDARGVRRRRQRHQLQQRHERRRQQRLGHRDHHLAGRASGGERVSLLLQLRSGVHRERLVRRRVPGTAATRRRVLLAARLSLPGSDRVPLRAGYVRRPGLLDHHAGRQPNLRGAPSQPGRRHQLAGTRHALLANLVHIRPADRAVGVHDGTPVAQFW